MTSTAVSSAGGHASRTSSRPDCRFPAVNKRLTAPWAMILVVFLCLVSHALAASSDAAAPVETLVIYHRPPHHEDQRWAVSPEHEIRRRQVQKRATLDEPEEGDSTESDEPEEADSTESSEPSKTSASHSVTTTFTIGAGSPKTSTTGTTVAASPLPSILDNVPSGFFSPGPNNGPAPCPIFINSFLDNPDFKRCYPISMLIQTSGSFFRAQQSLVGITRTLDATCAADVTFCTSYLTRLAQNLTAPENCQAEYNRGFASVVDAHLAMLAYAPVYGATCLRDPGTGAYCYANVITNASNPSSAHFYFLPLNKTLPGTTIPNCGPCLQQTMDLYQAATADRTQPIARTYASAAEQVNAVCGPDYVNKTLAEATVPSAAALGLSVTWLGAAMPLLLGSIVWLV